MFMNAAPIFLVILIGYCYGRFRPDSSNEDKLINDYVLYIALPALLFLAVARADISELKQWGFTLSTLFGILIIYLSASLIAKGMKITLPQSSILSMAACYGTTGYMGIPILISVYGEQAALPAAIATILHNIPTIMAVIISWDIFSSKKNSVSLSVSLWRAILTTCKNPLTLSVIAGFIFVLVDIKLPTFIESFAHFLGNAAGPTALFALGLGLSRLNVKEHFNATIAKIVLPIVMLKLFVQPLITVSIAYFIFGMRQEQGLWLVVAVVMAAQPIGAGAYVFAKKYNYQQNAISLSIIISLVLALISIPLILNFFPV